MMSKSEKIYKELSKTYTDAEIVDGFVFNDDSLSEEEQKKVDKEFRELRLQQLKNLSPTEVLYGKMMKLKLRIKKYIAENKFAEEYNFSNQLKLYSKIINRTNKEFADDLGIHQTKLSRVLNGRENPNVDLMYRLEEHSSGEIPAHHWWRIYSLELEYKIRTDLEKKVEESKKVKNQISLRA
ncbi:MAG: transcriptional regulator with XRE-family HTH domain [Saprospiraceae bacterium]|jgi:transcriptional regulator with XRE-family HTH domain